MGRDGLKSCWGLGQELSCEESEREGGFEPATACLEGIWLQAAWQPQRPWVRKASSYLLVKRAVDALPVSVWG
jgi:hypothetical protein